MRSLDDGTEFSQVQGENKVAYCRILLPNDLQSLHGDSGGSYKSDQSLLVMRVSHLKTGSSAFPVYYLPWRSNYMMRIKLKPSPKHPTKEKHRFWADETIEPDIFITAALQGCSIFVSGEPDQPVVYHINASSTKGPRDETLNTKDDDEFRVAAEAKLNKMTQLHQEAMAQFPKEGGKISTGRAAPSTKAVVKGVHLNDYMPDMLPSLQSVRKEEENKLLNSPFLSVLQYGTVFGHRKNNQWCFYRQTRTRILYEVKGNMNYQWSKPVCVKFWP